jgi:hypothetical protein
MRRNYPDYFSGYCDTARNAGCREQDAICLDKDTRHCEINASRHHQNAFSVNAIPLS